MSEIEKIIEKKEQEIKCPTCGAGFDIHEPVCPYCGTVNELGNEGQYLKHLDEIESDLSDVQNIPKEAMISEAKKAGHKAWPIIVTVLVIAAIVIVALLIIRNTQEKNNTERLIKLIEWQNENFPVLDQMYEEERYDDILTFQNEMYDTPDYDPLYMGEWEHTDFLSAYRWYDCLINYKDFYEEENQIGDYSKEILLVHCAELLYEGWDEKLANKRISRKEYDKIKEYQKTAIEFLDAHFGIDERQLDEFKARVIYDFPGVGVEYSKVKELSKEYEFID